MSADTLQQRKHVSLLPSKIVGQQLFCTDPLCVHAMTIAMTCLLIKLISSTGFPKYEVYHGKRSKLCFSPFINLPCHNFGHDDLTIRDLRESLKVSFCFYILCFPAEAQNNGIWPQGK